MSMSYQLEILWYQVRAVTILVINQITEGFLRQAERLRTLGWGEYLKVEMSNDRRTLTLSYWMYVVLSRTM